MYAEDLDGTLACLMEAADSLIGLDDDQIPAELQSGFVSLQTRINSLITFAEAYQRKVEQHCSTVKRVKAARPALVDDRIEDIDEDGELFELPVTAEAPVLATTH
jgi:hypothetical protein